MVGLQVDTASPDARQEPQPDSYSAPATDSPQLTSGEAFRTWYWLGVPLLAILAYATSLRVGFLADDFVLLFEGQHDVNLQTFLPPPPGPSIAPSAT